MPPAKVHTLVQIALLKGLSSTLPIKRIRLDQKEAAILYTEADFLQSAAMRNALASCVGEVREGDRAETEVRYMLKATALSARLSALVKFVKALGGEAL